MNIKLQLRKNHSKYKDKMVPMMRNIISSINSIPT